MNTGDTGDTGDTGGLAVEKVSEDPVGLVVTVGNHHHVHRITAVVKEIWPYRVDKTDQGHHLLHLETGVEHEGGEVAGPSQ